ncbi:hypothetical protein FXF61_13355 [Pseudomonas sp. C27(2019)]|uniref:hypothetical protein n=1 Tax=Pseudomonas sp. C27(2019) TaxID=2604941 RepID=UPI001243E1BF|nr:hypothetical protein [Pseudomonas sp. C27(2019)]QEY60072.1 hypothetical protein FXF61_13355 [Pseudomonas sp. C27(2019)]
MQISANAFSAGLSAIKAGQEQMTSAAQAIAMQSSATSASAAATPAVDMVQITEQLMQLEQAKQMSQLGARVLSSADEALGTLIDTQA